MYNLRIMDTSKNTLYWIIAILSIILFFTWCNNSQNDQRVSELEREIESLGGEQKKLDVKVSNQKIEQDKIYFSQQEAERKRASDKAQAERQRAEDAYNQEREEIERRQRASEQRAVDEYPYSYVLA